MSIEKSWKPEKQAIETTFQATVRNDVVWNSREKQGRENSIFECSLRHLLFFSLRCRKRVISFLRGRIGASFGVL